MATWGMAFDLRRCIGCNACTVACKQENNLPTGVFFTKTLTEEGGEYPDVKRVYVPTLCNHCESPPCEWVCPTGATYVRADGIVMVDEDKCIGCGSCIVACPYDVRTRVEPEHIRAGLFMHGELTAFETQGLSRFVAGTVVKCTFCHERVDAGMQPACVVTCPTDARIFGDLEDPQGKLRRLIRERGASAPLAEKNTGPKVFYVD